MYPAIKPGYSSESCLPVLGHTPNMVNEQDLSRLKSLTPFIIRTSKEWHEFVSTNPWKLSIVPKHMITTDMLREAVQKDGTILEIIRTKKYEYMLQNDIYELAVQNKGSVIQFVPEDCVSDRMCHNSICGSQGSGDNLKYIPGRMKTYELCKEAVNQKVSNLIYVPKEHITNDMINMAIEESIELLDIIDLSNMNIKMAKYAIEKGFSIDKLPKHLKNEELLNEIHIKNIPKGLLTKELCKKALEKSGENLEYIPKDFIDLEMLQIVLKFEGTLKFIKE